MKSEVKNVRAALEALRIQHKDCKPEGCFMAAFLEEGWAVCAGFGNSTTGGGAYYRSCQVDLLVSILRKAGLL